jgi:RING-box protein 2
MSVGAAASGGPDTVEDMELDANKNEKMFTLKKWNAVAMWSWDVECDTCAICRVQVMGENSFPF